MKKTVLMAVFGLLVGGAAMLMPVSSTRAQEGATTETSASTEERYTFEAQPGDSYSVLARKATQIYGIQTNTNMSLAQIIYVETMLTQANGSPLLNEGQAVSFTKASVKEWVDKALTLSDDQEAAWNYYVQFTDFNTNSAGERR